MQTLMRESNKKLFASCLGRICVCKLQCTGAPYIISPLNEIFIYLLIRSASLASQKTSNRERRHAPLASHRHFECVSRERRGYCIGLTPVDDNF